LNVAETGEATGGRSGAQRRPPACALGLSKAHISARKRRGSVTCYRNASFLQLRLWSDAVQEKKGGAPRGEISEFTTAARRRMLQLMAKVEQAAVPFFVTLTYEEDARREQSRALLEQDPGMFFLDSLRQWVARHSYDVVGSKSISHYRAGTQVEKLRTTKRAFAYAAKRYVAKKEEMPELEHKPGRFWGVVGRKHLPSG